MPLVGFLFCATVCLSLNFTVVNAAVIHLTAAADSSNPGIGGEVLFISANTIRSSSIGDEFFFHLSGAVANGTVQKINSHGPNKKTLYGSISGGSTKDVVSIFLNTCNIFSQFTFLIRRAFLFKFVE